VISPAAAGVTAAAVCVCKGRQHGVGNIQETGWVEQRTVSSAEVYAFCIVNVPNQTL
jgi:hypothetical protein